MEFPHTSPAPMSAGAVRFSTSTAWSLSLHQSPEDGSYCVRAVKTSEEETARPVVAAYSPLATLPASRDGDGLRDLLGASSRFATLPSAPSSAKRVKLARGEADELAGSGIAEADAANAACAPSPAWYARRFALFRRYAEGVVLPDAESWYSVTPEASALRIAQRSKDFALNVLDVCGGCAGNAIAYARLGARVVCVDTDPTRLEAGRRNARVYGVESRIDFVLSDALELLMRMRNSAHIVDLVFLSPPWGGLGYAKAGGAFDADKDVVMRNPATKQVYYGADLVKAARNVSAHVIYYLPRNTNRAGMLRAFGQSFLAEFLTETPSDRVIALCAYFGPKWRVELEGEEATPE